MRQVVVIDDKLPNALLIKGFAGQLPDVDISVFTDPQRALDWCIQNTPDLVLLDYVMPDMDGGAFLAHMRARPALEHVPVIVITAEASRETLYKVLEFGLTDFLRKPVDDLELIARARNMLNLRARETALADANERLRRMATTDPLTGLANRRHFFDRLEIELERSRRHGRPLCLAMLDCDGFKQINDEHGHAVGDQVLKALACLLRRSLRKADLPARVGGEEFAVLMPDTSLANAAHAIESLLGSIRAQEVEAHAHCIRYTVSAGLAQARVSSVDVGALLRGADTALYAAKKAGRDRLCIKDPDAGDDFLPASLAAAS